MNRCPALIGMLSLPLLVSGCSSVQPSTLQRDTTYEVEWIGERPLIDRSHLTMTLASDGRAYGSSGCNHWFAHYQLQGEQLTFSEIGSTRKACAPALMEQEQRYLHTLQQTTRWDFSNIEQLRLWPGSAQPIRLWQATD